MWFARTSISDLVKMPQYFVWLTLRLLAGRKKKKKRHKKSRKKPFALLPPKLQFNFTKETKIIKKSPSLQKPEWTNMTDQSST